MSQPEVVKSLSEGDSVVVDFKSIGMYNAGSSVKHTGTVVKKINVEDKSPFEYKIIYKTDSGEIFLFDGKVGYIYTHEEDKLRHLEGIKASIVPESKA